MKKEKNGICAKILIVILAITSVLTLASCKNQSKKPSFTSNKDVADFLTGTWEDTQDHTYIRIESTYYDSDKTYVIKTGPGAAICYKLPAKSDWEKTFRDKEYLMTLLTDSQLNSKSFYSSENIADIGLILGLSKSDLSDGGVWFPIGSEYDVNSNKIQSSLDTAFYLYINDDGTITIENKSKGKSCTYSRVSSDPEWFFKETKSLWDNAVKAF